MSQKQLLLGDEALALGALHAGLSGVYAYPGTPSTEITEFIQSHPLTAERGVHCRWSVNEKTAMEEALGMSFAGKRSLVCFKHVGLNVCADPFMGSAVNGAGGGLVIASCDDPSMHSSQNEQDSRFYASFALMPVFEPSSQQEAYEMAREAFDYSESRGIPVMMRLTTRLSHSRAIVEGLDYMRSSVIIVEPYSGSGKEMDNGLLLGVSPKVKIEFGGHSRKELADCLPLRPAKRPKGGYGDVMESIASDNQGILKEHGDWVVLPQAVINFASGNYAVDDDGTLMFRDNGAFRRVLTVEFSEQGRRCMP